MCNHLLGSVLRCGAGVYMSGLIKMLIDNCCQSVYLISIKLFLSVLGGSVGSLLVSICPVNRELVVFLWCYNFVCVV